MQRLGTKADILHCLENETTRPVSAPVVNANFLNGAASSYCADAESRNSKKRSKIMQTWYADMVFTPLYIFSGGYSQSCGRHQGYVQAR